MGGPFNNENTTDTPISENIADTVWQVVQKLTQDESVYQEEEISQVHKVTDQALERWYIQREEPSWMPDAVQALEQWALDNPERWESWRIQEANRHKALVTAEDEDVAADLRGPDSANNNADKLHMTNHLLEMVFGSNEDCEIFRRKISPDSPYGDRDIIAAVCAGGMVDNGAKLQVILNSDTLQNEKLRELRSNAARTYRMEAFKDKNGRMGTDECERTGNIPGLAYACERGKAALAKQYNALPPEKQEDMKANYNAITTFLDDTCKSLVSRVFDPKFSHETTKRDRDQMSTHFKKIIDEMKADQKKASQDPKKSAPVMGGGGPMPK